MDWEILSVRRKVKGPSDSGCYSITLAIDSNKEKAYIARYCVDPRVDKDFVGMDHTNPRGLGHSKNIFEATEICNRDAIAYHRK